MTELFQNSEEGEESDLDDDDDMGGSTSQD